MQNTGSPSLYCCLPAWISVFVLGVCCPTYHGKDRIWGPGFLALLFRLPRCLSYLALSHNKVHGHRRHCGTTNVISDQPISTLCCESTESHGQRIMNIEMSLLMTSTANYSTLADLFIKLLVQRHFYLNDLSEVL